MTPSEIEAESLKEEALYRAKRRNAAALALLFIACESCGGMGDKAYSNTSGHLKRPGGCAITMGVCDVCWGTGRNDKIGAKP